MTRVLAKSFRYRNILDTRLYKTPSFLSASASSSTQRMLHDVSRWLQFGPHSIPRSVPINTSISRVYVSAQVSQVRYVSSDSKDDLEKSYEEWRRGLGVNAADGFTDAERDYVGNRRYYDLNPHEFYAALAPKENHLDHMKIRIHIDFILAEYEAIKFATSRVPSTLYVEDMKELLRLCTGETGETIQQYFNHLYRKELGKFFESRIQANRKLRSQERIQEMRTWILENREADWSVFDREGKPIYTLWKNTMFMRFKRPHIKAKGSISRLRRSALFGSQLILDFSWHSLMSERECKDIASQVQRLYNENRDFKDPFDLWFVNLPTRSYMFEVLKGVLANIECRKDHMIHITDKNHTDLFDKHRLVYITPYGKPSGKNDMQQFDHNLIYIMACYQDKKEGPNSYSKAQQEGLAHMTLPFDKYLEWGRGSKTLSMNNVLKILDQLKMSASWQTALSHGVPQQRLKSSQDIEKLYKKRIKLMKKAIKWTDSKTLLMDDEEPIKSALRNVKALLQNETKPTKSRSSEKER